MPAVETVLGPVPADQLGNVDAHEHVFLRTPVNPGDEFLDPGKATAELTAVARSGIQAVVDLTPVGLGRQPRQLAEVSRATGLHIIAATGYHRAAHYHDGHWARHADEQTLLNVLLADLRTGMDAHDWEFPWPEPTGHKAGIVKLGASYQRMNPIEQRWFTAGAAAARQTGAPVAVHTEIGTAAHAILDLLDQHGVPPHRVMLAHTDRNPDPELHVDLIARGACLVYDTIGRIKYRPDSVVLDLIEHIANAGKLDHLCLGTDIGRKSTFTAYGGGPGMDVLGREFIPRLQRRIGPDGVNIILQQAPQRFLTWTDPGQD
jgi:phosphotriesterase-related protein